MSDYQDPNVPFIPDRTVLPIHEPTYAPCREMFADNNPPAPPPRFTVEAPEGAPNVIIFLIDDMGFGATSAFGGPIPMPTAERLAQGGMKFNRFHTTSICAPTRAALLSGYNHHSVNMGNITEMGTAYPGNLSTRPKSVTPLAKVLSLNGFATAQFGKCHETPVWETTTAGPFEHWPVHSGFDKFYGFLAAETNQYRPALVDGLNRVPVPECEDYHLTEDLADHCIRWIKDQKCVKPDRPYFVYFAPGATHAPHQSPESYRDMFKGQFDSGWDELRKQTHKRMLDMGVLPQGTKLANKPAAMRDWDDLSPMEKKVYAREMELYAGFARHTDDQIGRVVDAVEQMGDLDNTVIFYILGDNGASGEGGPNGLLNENSFVNHAEELVEYLHEHLDELGTEMAYNHYANGWAVAMDTPFMWTKQVASNFGGTRNGMIAHYPAKYKAAGEVHNQFHHVIDVAPTVYELCGIPLPKEVDGVKQRPMEGVSMKYSMDNAAAEDQRKTQYFAIFDNHGVYHDGWFCGVVDRTPFSHLPMYKRSEDAPWELYHVENDFSMSDDLAAQMPEKVEEMKKIFFDEGLKYNVFPMETRSEVIMVPKLAGRPTAFGSRTELTLHDGMSIPNLAFIDVKNRSFTLTAEVEVSKDHTDGVIFAIGGRFGGMSLYVKDEKPCFCYNYVRQEYYYVKSEKPLTDERNQIVLDFKYDGGGIGKGGLATLYVNNQKVAEGRIDNTIMNQWSFDETVDVGEQISTPVTEEYTVKDSRFQGRIFSVNVKTESMSL